MEGMFQKAAFQSLGKEKLALLEEMVAAGKGKTPMELMDLMVKYGNRLTGGRPLSPLEKDALIEAMRESAAPEERKRIDEVVNMLRVMGKI